MLLVQRWQQNKYNYYDELRTENQIANKMTKIKIHTKNIEKQT